MKVSYNLLQTFFENKLPEVKEVVSLFEKHLAEVEEVVQKGDDTVLDINILPDRAAYALSHEGVGYELSLLLEGNTFKKREVLELQSSEEGFPVEVKSELCDKYIAVSFDEVDNSKETPKEIKDVLENLGQRSINFLVDLANYVMLEVGQPLHVFDREKIDGGIIVRTAENGEKITTLDNKEVALTGGELVIADKVAPLAIAGIKGGKKAEVTKDAKNIVLEAAHFDGSSTRKTSVKVQIKTDASKRFENKIDASFAIRGASQFVALLNKYAPETKPKAVSIFTNTKEEDIQIIFTLDFISEKLGRDFTSQEVGKTLEKMGLVFEEKDKDFSVKIPKERKDLRIPEDIVDEVGRLFGYDLLSPKLPRLEKKGEKDKIFNLGNKARNFFLSKGFSEVYTHALLSVGEVALANPLASDKAFLRTELTATLKQKITENLHNAELLGQSEIKIFEIGKVFKDGKEFNSLAAGIGVKKVNKQNSPNEAIKLIRDEFVAFFGSKAQTLCTIDDSGGLVLVEGKQIGKINNEDGIFEIDFDAFCASLENEETNLLYEKTQNKMSPVSVYPFISRDVAFFVPSGNKEDLEETIKNAAGDLLVRLDLFDKFEKKNKETGEIEKISYGYRLVFQSFERTLTDEEINVQMDNVYGVLRGLGFEVR